MSRSFVQLYADWICRLQKCGGDRQAIAPLQQRYDDLRSQAQAICYTTAEHRASVEGFLAKRSK